MQDLFTASLMNGIRLNLSGKSYGLVEELACVFAKHQQKISLLPFYFEVAEIFQPLFLVFWKDGKICLQRG